MKVVCSVGKETATLPIAWPHSVKVKPWVSVATLLIVTITTNGSWPVVAVA